MLRFIQIARFVAVLLLSPVLGACGVSSITSSTITSISPSEPAPTAIVETSDIPMLGALMPIDLHLLEGATSWRLSETYIGQVAYSPTGERIAIAGSRGVFIYKTDSLALVQTIPTSGEVVRIAWAPNGENLAGGLKDGTVWIWDVATGNRLHIFTVGSNVIASITWAPDGKRLASGEYFRHTIVWYVASGETVFTLDTGGNSYPFVAWSPNGKWLAGGCECNSTRLWDAESGEPLVDLEGYEGGPPSTATRSIAWSPASDNLAVGLIAAPAVLIFDPEAGKKVATLTGHTKEILGIAWSPDGKRLASGSIDGTVRLWNIETRQTISTLDNVGYVNSVDWSPNGEYIAIGNVDGIFIQWNVRREAETK